MFRPSIKRSTSCVSKPMTPISKSISAFKRNCSPVARISSSQPALFIVSEDIGSLLLRTHMINANAGNRCEAKKPRRFGPTMAGENHTLPVDNDRIGEAELADAFRDLPDLLLRVSSRVPRIRRQLIWRAILDAQRGHEGSVFPSSDTFLMPCFSCPSCKDSLAERYQPGGKFAKNQPQRCCRGIATHSPPLRLVARICSSQPEFWASLISARMRARFCSELIWSIFHAGD